MKLRRLLLPVFLGALVGGVVMVWPVRPLWTVHPEEPARIQTFSKDGQELITTPQDTGKARASASRWDVRTGQMLGKVDFAGLEGFRLFYHVMNDKKTVVGGASTMLNPNQGSQWWLFDLHSGAKVAGPFEITKGVEGILNTTSDDGRWYCLIRKEEDASERSIDLHSRDGKFVYRWKPESGWIPGQLCISPDGNRAAVLWSNTPKGSTKPADRPVRVTVHELPSCREEKRFETPACGHAAVHKWEGEILDIVTVSWPVIGQDPVSKIYVFRLDQPDVKADALDPRLSSYHEGRLHFRVSGYGPEWIAYFSILPLDQAFPEWEKWYDWAVEKLGGKSKPNPAPRGVFRVIDRRTGQFRQSLPGRVTIDVRLSPDGKWLASSLEDGGIAMWDLDPTPRWFKAVPAGVGTFALLMLWGWWRGRRKAAAGAAA